MMVKFLFYGYIKGELSSRRLAQKLEKDVASRVLAAGNRPQHRTNCEFWRRHRAVSGAVVQLGRGLGLVSLATLVMDSTKVRAHASKREAMSCGRMQQEEAQLSVEIEALQAAANDLETAEDAPFGMDLLADAGYRNERDLQALKTRGIDGKVALGREGHTSSGRAPGARASPTSCTRT